MEKVSMTEACYLLKVLKKYEIRKNETLGFNYDIEKYVIVEDLIKEYNALKREQQIILPPTFLKDCRGRNDVINKLFDMHNFIYRLNRYEGGK